MKQHFSILFIVLAVSGSMKAAAQTLEDFFGRIKQVNTAKQISYQYRVYLMNSSSDTRIDSVVGILYKNGYSYIDSNSLSNTFFNGRYFCKLDHVKKTGAVYDAEILKNKLGMSFDKEEGSTVYIPDSVVLKYAKSNVKLLPDGDYHVQLVFSNQLLLKTEFVVDKNSYLVKEAYIETYESEDKSQIKTYSMKGINYTVPSYRFNPDNYFRIDKGKAVLNSRYAKYTLTTLINHS